MMTGSVREVLRSDDGMEMGADDMALLKAIIVKFPSFKGLIESDHHLQVSFTGEISATDLNRFCFNQGITSIIFNELKRNWKPDFLKSLNEFFLIMMSLLRTEWLKLKSYRSFWVMLGCFRCSLYWLIFLSQNSFFSSKAQTQPQIR
jgi:hypothetical protein